MPDIAPTLVPVLGTDTHTWVYGTPGGAPIVLVHGFRGDHHGLEGIALELSDRLHEHTIYVPDLPGFGESPAIAGREHNLDLYGEWLQSFTDHIAPAGGVVLGHSFGSLVVSSGLAHGTQSTQTILINPISAPALEGPKAILTQLAIAYYRVADALPERGARAVLGNPLIVRGMSEVMAKTREPRLRSWIHDQHDRYFSRFATSQSLLEAFRASVSHTVSEYTSAYTMPTLLIAGEHDDITPLAKQLDLQRAIPKSQLQIIPGTGHLVHYEAVGDAVDGIVRFINGPTTKAAHTEASGE